MTKKSRRARAKSSRKVSQAATETVVVAAIEPDADRQEYAYVVTDLRQVAALAAAMFVLLIGLSFFIG